jgi:hypothetical protein
VGSSLLGHSRGSGEGLLNDFDFTADLVRVNDRPEGKVGRRFRPSPRLVRLDWSRVGATGPDAAVAAFDPATEAGRGRAGMRASPHGEGLPPTGTPNLRHDPGEA